MVFFIQAEDGIRDWSVTGVQTCALPISLQQPVGDARRAAAAARDLRDAGRIRGDAEDPGRARDDLDEIVGWIVVQALDESEPRAQRRGQQPEARGGADQRETLELHRERLRVRAVGDAHVPPELLPRRIQELFERGPPAVDLIYKKNVAPP